MKPKLILIFFLSHANIYIVMDVINVKDAIDISCKIVNVNYNYFNYV